MSVRKKRTRQRRQKVREEILDVTRELVLSGGLAGLTLTAIADELELTKAALYYYFDSKDALLFELVFETMESEVEAVEDAIARATSGAIAVEALIRAVSSHYRDRLDEFRLCYLAGQVGESLQVEPEFVERIRPLNDRLYARATALLRADQEAGFVDAAIDARRTVFLAHCAVLGVLTMEGVVDAADDALIHAHSEMIDDLVRTHTATLR